MQRLQAWKTSASKPRETFAGSSVISPHHVIEGRACCANSKSLKPEHTSPNTGGQRMLVTTCKREEEEEEKNWPTWRMFICKLQQAYKSDTSMWSMRKLRLQPSSGRKGKGLVLAPPDPKALVWFPLHGFCIKDTTQRSPKTLSDV